jgi:hypothetical protein
LQCFDEATRQHGLAIHIEASDTLPRRLPDEISVKSVAMSQGFWHFGRFARDYKLLFGENPSVTLADSSDLFA